MPRIVDTAARRNEIVRAAETLLGQGGFPRLTLANLAKELGGSIRLVTHYFKDRDELISALLENGVREVDGVLEMLHSEDDPRERLRLALEWFLPDDDESVLQERVRIALITHQHSEPIIAEYFSTIEGLMRSVLHAAIPSDLPKARAELLVDIMRAWASGIALASVEHPETWTFKRQHEVMAEFLRAFEVTVFSTRVD